MYLNVVSLFFKASFVEEQYAEYIAIKQNMLKSTETTTDISKKICIKRPVVVTSCVKDNFIFSQVYFEKNKNKSDKKWTRDIRLKLERI